MNTKVTHELLDKIAASFNSNDPDAIVSHFREDGEFVNGKGPAETGDVYSGKDQIRTFFSELFKATPKIQWNIIKPNLIDGNLATTRWRRVAVGPDGKSSEWLGCD